MLLALFAAELAESFGGTIVYAALPRLMREFGDPVTVGWLVTGHSLIATSAALMAGRIGAMFGVRRSMLAFLACAMAGSSICAFSNGFPMLMAGRSLQGVGAAVFPLSISLLRVHWPVQRIPVGLGLITSAASIGAASGLVLGGIILDNFDWHWMFGASALLLCCAWLAVRLLVHGGERQEVVPRIDLIDGFLPVPAICAILLAVSSARQSGWGDPLVLGLLAGGGFALVFWGWRSLRLSHPFLDLRLLARRNVAIPNLITVLVALGTMQITLVFSSYVQSPSWTMVGLGLSATVAGLAKLPSNFLSFFAGPFSGWLTQRAGNRTALLSGTVLVTVSWLAATVLPDNIYLVVALICGVSFGTTILFAAIPNAMVAAVPVNSTGDVIGAMIVLRGLFMGAGAQIVTILFASHAVSQSGVMLPSAQSFRSVMLWIASLSGFAAVLAFAMPRKIRAATDGQCLSVDKNMNSN
ncbi:MFS transporter [Novosphingobium malaysiense]|uniref:Major facilitator superfamily (MFS) profile domain-containing protein n=1 Tax=Novosphingobium malaysiense TaxID=1348853 RepID=A0A0B1ZMC9_9SPHN|nr:MFS transporter [Novosphingobium malaysiense]KHK90425.1 hypothetical protein LK12_17785 [Novosphingobium malaysiense]